MEENKNPPAPNGGNGSSGYNSNGMPSSRARSRKRIITFLSLVFAAAGISYGVYWYEIGQWHEATDDAYVAGHVVPVTPQIGGTVLAVHAEDTQLVKAGAALVELDHADARVALDQAESALAQTVREVRTLYANNATLTAQIKVRQAEVDRWKQDIARREAIANTGAVALEEIDHARDALKAADAALTTAKEQLAASQAQTSGVNIEQFPGVLRASSKVEEAWLAWARSNVVSPVDGQIARRNVQVGQRVAPGTPLMTVVPLQKVWVDANFKEVQLRHMTIGQKATLTADVYGSKVEYHGVVAGLGAGTGAAFSLLPAQNATGNWIKVVQRVPVRIALDSKELAEHPLRIGLSMQVEVDMHENHGEPVTASAPADDRFAAADQAIEQAKARAREIIQHNLVAGAKG